MQKVRYEIDPHNRLVVKEAGKKTKLPRFRQVLDGHFKVAKDNTLIYQGDGQAFLNQSESLLF
jgi:hypothetical protein